MDVALGVSMGSAAIGLVLVEGENADGATVDDDKFFIATDDASVPLQVLAAILGTREGATEGGYRLASTGVSWTHPTEAAALRDALATHKIENVVLVSAFLAAAALAQNVGEAIGYRRTAMLLIEPGNATVAIVDSDDGSVSARHTESLAVSERGADVSADTVARLAAMVMSTTAPDAQPEGVFVVGSDIDVTPFKAALEAAIPLRVNAPEEPEMALARGAALAAANAPLFASSTAAMAYAQDPGTDDPRRYTFGGYHGDCGLSLAADNSESAPIAHSGIANDDADTVVVPAAVDHDRDAKPRRRPLLLAGSLLAVVGIGAVVALEVALAINIRPAVTLLPNPVQNLIVPAEQEASPVQQPAPTPLPTPNPRPAPAPRAVPAVPETPTAVVRAPASPAPPPPAAPAPAPAPMPVPVSVIAPVPVPAPTPPTAPAPVPVPVPVPVIAPVPVPVPAPPAPVQVPNIELIQLPLNLPGVVTPPPLQLPAPPIGVPIPPPPFQIPTPTPPAQRPTPKTPIQQPKPKAPAQRTKPKAPIQRSAPKAPIQQPQRTAPAQRPKSKAPPRRPTIQRGRPAPRATTRPAPAAPPVRIAPPAAPRIPSILPNFGAGR